jgi:hypothetical protein
LRRNDSLDSNFTNVSSLVDDSTDNKSYFNHRRNKKTSINILHYYGDYHRRKKKKCMRKLSDLSIASTCNSSQIHLNVIDDESDENEQEIEMNAIISFNDNEKQINNKRCSYV